MKFQVGQTVKIINNLAKHGTVTTITEVVPDYAGRSETGYKLAISPKALTCFGEWEIRSWTKLDKALE